MSWWQDIPIPKRMAARPKDARGYPIPANVTRRDDGTWDFAKLNDKKVVKLLLDDCCGLCGQPLRRMRAFLGGPISLANRTWSDPPGHPECLAYAAAVCPFIVLPTARYRKAHDGECIDPHMATERPEQFFLVKVDKRYVERHISAASGILFRVPSEAPIISEEVGGTDSSELSGT
jgi:hypothetical protein